MLSSSLAEVAPPQLFSQCLTARWRSRLARALNLLTSLRIRPRQLRILTLDDLVHSGEVNPENARWWGLPRHGHDPCPGGRPARHGGDPASCLFCPCRRR